MSLNIDDQPAALLRIHRVLDDKWSCGPYSPCAHHSALESIRCGCRSLSPLQQTNPTQELELHGFEVVRCGYFFALTVIPLLLLRALPYRLGIRKSVATEATLGASGGLRWQRSLNEQMQ